MKGSFSRSFYPALIVLLVTLGGIGFLFQTMAKTMMENRAMERLKTEAETVSQLASAYHSSNNERTDIFFINLSVASQVSGSDTVICDDTGMLLLCSHGPMGCDHQGMTISRAFMDYVIDSGYVRDIGMIEGLYDDPRYVVSVPIVLSDGTVLGIVISSMPMTANMQILKRLSKIYLSFAVVAVLLAVIVMSWVARRHSNPLQQISRSAFEFGHGDLNARVAVSSSYPKDIQELAISFNNMADSLQKSEYRRQEFVANVSHELKTPMTTIAGFADGILDGTIPQEKQAHYLRLISDETKRLSRLVRSMLDTTRLQAGERIEDEKKTRFDITESAGQVILSFERKINEKELNVSVEMPDYPVYTHAQQDGIMQVLYNLLDNGVKFCPQKGDLTLNIRTGGNKIYVSVGNSGATIPPQELPLVFDRFHKLDKSRSENRDGWGLGLYIVRTIIGAHGEDISVSSQDGYTQFVFTLPLVN